MYLCGLVFDNELCCELRVAGCEKQAVDNRQLLIKNRKNGVDRFWQRVELDGKHVEHWTFGS